MSTYCFKKKEYIYNKREHYAKKLNIFNLFFTESNYCACPLRHKITHKWKLSVNLRSVTLSISLRESSNPLKSSA